ncbi:GspH/FimT family pseudopilin [Pseudomonas sp. GD03721]|jgi:type IV fimbrial biogenesis protein FimT|nr:MULTISPECIES: GspH/FimT family pseudopilin [unclassified Pseudomonas]MDH1443707.1 GspH/FimT family pseudopilin [Pseudomonas sp. GD03722]WGG02618.1 GspH/FimT family pseudopilin [Pseudomonas sp. GD03721]WGG06787.1 GspH/FimT family pseudopilin [Pseudomonas sp. GD03919]
MLRHHHQHAQTLPELLITLSILTIVIGFVTPAVGSLLQKNRHTSEINQLHASLNFARSMAIQTRTMVSLCAGDHSCEDSRNWQGRILIFVDKNRNGALDDDEQLLKAMDINPRHRWHWSNFRQQTYMSFRPDGMTHSLNGTFTLCDQQLAIKGLVINITGRAITSQQADPDKCQG